MLRPGVLGEHIAEFKKPEDAQWVAKRLNFAALIERIALTSMDDHALGTRVAEAISDYKASPD